MLVVEGLRARPSSIQTFRRSGFESPWDDNFLLVPFNPQRGSTTAFHEECEPWQDEQHDYDAYQTKEDPDMFETETASQSRDVVVSN